MNTAQRFYAELLELPAHEDADAKIAVEQTRLMTERYLAPHANRPTPPRPHHSRITRSKFIRH